MYIRVVVTPNSKKESFVQVSDNQFEISVREKAERNLVNKKIINLINKYYNYPEGGVKIINGQHSRIKLLKVGNQ